MVKSIIYVLCMSSESAWTWACRHNWPSISKLQFVAKFSASTGVGAMSTPKYVVRGYSRYSMKHVDDTFLTKNSAVRKLHGHLMRPSITQLSASSYEHKGLPNSSTASCKRYQISNLQKIRTYQGPISSSLFLLLEPEPLVLRPCLDRALLHPFWMRCAVCLWSKIRGNMRLR
jgi:hypothetical protein